MEGKDIALFFDLEKLKDCPRKEELTWDKVTMDDDLVGTLKEIFGEDNVVIWGEQMEGTIVRMFSDKKFGFIQDESGKDYFFHASDVNGFFDDLVEDLQKGEKINVTFDVVVSPKGTRASNVTRVVGGVA